LIFPKPQNFPNKAYLEYVRSHPCLFPGCPEPAQAHHLHTRGRGIFDYTAVPLCAEHHTGSVSYHKLGPTKFLEVMEQETGITIDFWKEAFWLLHRWLEKMEVL
jgi:hypothetical protein